jgi:adenosylhomocysteinase
LTTVIRDISLAIWRKEIEIAETEMPGLMALRRIRAVAAAEGRAHHRLAAHDDPDRGADRDADRARRDRSAGLVQHLLDPGPRAAAIAATGVPGRSPSRARTLENIGTYVTASRLGAHRRPDLPTCSSTTAATAPCSRCWGARVEAGEELLTPTNEEEEIFVATLKRFIAERPGLPHQDGADDQGRVGRTTTGVHRLYELAKKGKLPVPGDQRQTIASPSRSSTTSTAARNRWSTPSAAAPT